jgi:hypothetical protein
VDLTHVQDEIASAVATIDGLRSYPWGTLRVTPPQAMVGWPANYQFDDTMGRGMDSTILPLFILVGHMDARISRERLGMYLDGDGPQSVKAALERFQFTSCDSARAARARVEMVRVAEQEYLGAVFEIEIFGKGNRWASTQT